MTDGEIEKKVYKPVLDPPLVREMTVFERRPDLLDLPVVGARVTEMRKWAA